MTRVGQYLTPGANVTAYRERGWGNFGGGVAPPPLSGVLTIQVCNGPLAVLPETKVKWGTEHILGGYVFQDIYFPNLLAKGEGG